MSFHPSQSLPPVIRGADPRAYHLQNPAYPKGHPRFVMSRSELLKFAECPRKWLKNPPVDATPAMEWGSLVDMLVLTPKWFDRDYAVAPSEYETTGMRCPKCESVTDSGKCAKCKTERVEVKVKEPWNWNSKTCQEWRSNQEQAGKTIVKQSLLTDARRAVIRLGEDQEIATILTASDRQVQVNVEWHDATGIRVPVKCMLDLVPRPESTVGDTLWDFKTAESAEGRRWSRAVFAWQLHYQAALYSDAMNAASGLQYRRYGHVIQESSAPFEPTHRLLSEEFIAMGRIDYTSHLQHYCWCLSTGKWPGYDTTIVEPEAWMLKV